MRVRTLLTKVNRFAQSPDGRACIGSEVVSWVGTGIVWLFSLTFSTAGALAIGTDIVPFWGIRILLASAWGRGFL